MALPVRVFIPIHPREQRTRTQPSYSTISRDSTTSPGSSLPTRFDSLSSPARIVDGRWHRKRVPAGTPCRRTPSHQITCERRTTRALRRAALHCTGVGRPTHPRLQVRLAVAGGTFDKRGRNEALLATEAAQPPLRVFVVDNLNDVPLRCRHRCLVPASNTLSTASQCSSWKRQQRGGSAGRATHEGFK